MTTPINRKQPPIFSAVPRPKQQLIIDGQKPLTTVRAPRRLGKTFICDFIAGTAFLSSATAIQIALCSFALNSAKRVLFAELLRQLSPLPAHVRHVKADDMLVNEQTGSTIQLFGLSSEHGHKIRGHSFDLAILDEYPLVDYDVFSRALRPTLLDRDGWLFCIGTPSGSFDLMHLLENEIRNNPDRGALFHFNAYECIGEIPNLTPEFLEAEKQRDPQAFELEWMCNIEASGLDSIFTLKMINEATTDELPVH